MRTFHGLSPNLFPVADLCFYGQRLDDTWFREDILIPFDTPKSYIESKSIALLSKNNLKYISWGLDSKFFVIDGQTGITNHVANILQLDFDGEFPVDFVLKRVAFLQEDKLISSNPDVMKSGRGYHIWVYELFDFDLVRKIIARPYIQDFLCDKFIRTTFKLRSSVLRLSDNKYGAVQKISIIEEGVTDCKVGRLYQRFVRGILDENVGRSAR